MQIILIRIIIPDIDTEWDLFREVKRDGRDLVFELSLTLKDTAFLELIKMNIDFA